MLTRRLAAASPAKIAGFTLIEMMVAIVLGMLVVGAVLAFIVSLVRANSETVLSTRLNQELRATMALISNDVRRARGLMDPIAAVGKGGVVANPYSTIDLSTANCMRYSYAETTGGTTNYRAVRLDTTTGKGLRWDGTVAADGASTNWCCAPTPVRRRASRSRRRATALSSTAIPSSRPTPIASAIRRWSHR